jgi:hypothetical protein
MSNSGAKRLMDHKAGLDVLEENLSPWPYIEIQKRSPQLRALHYADTK